MKKIVLYFNKLSAIHPRMFSHVVGLRELDLRSNVCVDKIFWTDITSRTEIEHELIACGVAYTFREPLKTIRNDQEMKFEAIENSLKTINEKLERREKEVDRKFQLITELVGTLDERNEENAANITEIKRMVEKIFDVFKGVCSA